MVSDVFGRLRAALIREVWRKLGHEHASRIAADPWVDLRSARPRCSVRPTGKEAAAVMAERTMWKQATALIEHSDEGGLSGEFVWLNDAYRERTFWWKVQEKFRGGPVRSMLCITDGVDHDGSGSVGIKAAIEPPGDWPEVTEEVLGSLCDHVNRQVCETASKLIALAEGDMYAVLRREPISKAEETREERSLLHKPWSTKPHRVIFMRPGEQREYTPSEAVGTGREQAPHHRRGHWRTLRHEKHKDKQGDQIWVRAAWVGPREWNRDGATYRVLGD